MSLIAHVHVPKTAGSTINALLRRHVGTGQDHIQGVVNDPDALAALASENLWIAGHVPAPRLKEALDACATKASFVTSLREPNAHVASHYNWLIEIGHKGQDFLNGHPPAIREIHQRISASDNSNPLVIIENLEKNPGLFLNCQTSYVVGQNHEFRDARYAEALDMFDAVVFSDDLATGIAAIIPGQDICPEKTNASNYHFDPAVFETPELQSFLAERNRADEELWRMANGKFRPSGNGVAS